MSKSGEKRLEWLNVGTQESRDFECGYCGKPVSSDKGWSASRQNGYCPGWIYICSRCKKPNVFLKGVQLPSPPFGKEVHAVKEGVDRAYNEARRCMQVQAYTAVVMLCRKILMQVAVEKGADPDKKYGFYVDYLDKEELIARDSKGWVDHIREKANEANHQIPDMTEEDAKRLMKFTQMLLTVMYEFPSEIPSKQP